MLQHDFRISKQIREKLDIKKSVFVTEFDLQRIYN